MKHLLFALLAGPVCFAADFQTGQAARLVIGQTTFTQSDTGAQDILLGAAGGVAYANGILFVVDSNRFFADPVNNRVLLFPTNGVPAGTFPGPVSPFPKPYDELTFPTPLGNTCLVCLGTATVYLGQPDANNATPNTTQNGFNIPTAVATDGTHVVVADSDNNRILIWNSIPTQRFGQNADVVVGQADFTHNATAVPPNSKSLRGPQGVWIQNGKLFVADTQDHRVLIYNQIPTSNGAAADVVLGQPNFTTTVPATTITPAVAANTLFSPVSVTSDGTHLFVTDLGNTRVLIWNSIPTTNQQPADVEIGQPDMTTALDNNTPALCASNGKDSSGNPTYPSRCNKTLSFPRFALSDGKRLWIADGGNDRVLVYSQIPTSNAAAADYVLGAPDDLTDNPSLATDAFETPTSLAWDGTNLYVADVFNRRVLAYSMGDVQLPLTAMRNAASQEVFALGSVTIGGTITANDTVTITIGTQDSSGNSLGTKDYVYTVQKTDALNDVVNGLVKAINASPGDPNVTARPDLTTEQVLLVAKQGGSTGTSVTLAVSTSTNATETATTSGATLSLNLQNAAVLGPGSLVTVFGTNLADTSASADLTQPLLPNRLGGVEVYFDGIMSPIVSVTPTQITAQLPFETQDRSSVTAYVRTVHNDGSVSVTNNQGIPIVVANPGIFADPGGDPRPGLVYHAYANATSAVSVDGTIAAKDVGTITINGVAINYTVQQSDTLQTVQQAFVALINAQSDATGVTAIAGNVFTRILLVANKPGADANNITVTASVPTGASLILTALTAQLCCSDAHSGLVTIGGTITANDVATININGEVFNYTMMGSEAISDVAQALTNMINADANSEATAQVSDYGNGVVLSLKPNAPPGPAPFAVSVSSGATVTLTPSTPQLCCTNTTDMRVTDDNPARPGEVLYVYATGLGPSINGIDDGRVATADNSQDPPVTPVDSILAGGSTANILFTGFAPGLVGVYEVQFQLNSGLTTDPLTQMTIAQQSQVSNVVTFPLVAPAASSPTSSASPAIRRPPGMAQRYVSPK